MHNCFEGEETYKSINRDSYAVCLLLLIKRIAYLHESKSYLVLVIHMALRKVYSTYQSRSSSCNKYFDTVTSLIDITSHCVGGIDNHTFLINNLLKEYKPADMEKLTKNKTAAAKTATEESYMTMDFYQASTKADTACY